MKQVYFQEHKTEMFFFSQKSQNLYVWKFKDIKFEP